MAELDVLASEAKTTGRAVETIDPVDGGLNVHVAGNDATLAVAAAASTLLGRLAPTIDPTDSGINVHLAGGSITVTGVATQVTLAALLAANHTDLTGGGAKAIVRGGAKGATTAADVTSTANGADHNGLDVVEQYAPAYEDNTNGVAGTQWKPLAVSTYTPSLFANRAANATLNVKASAGNVFSCSCLNLNAAVRYLQLHNTATVPGNGAVPLVEFPVPALGGFTEVGSDFFTSSGLNFSTGIAFAFSTTPGTYTAGSAADEHTQVVFK